MNIQPLPYKKAFIYIGKTEAFVSLSWYCRTTGKYKREKLRPGLRGLNKKDLRSTLTHMCSEINKEVAVRNISLTYHDSNDFNFGPRYQDAPLLKLIEQFRVDENTPPYQKEQSQAFKTRFSEFSNKHPAVALLYLSMISENVMRLYVRFLQNEKKLTGKTINTHLWVFGKLAERLKKDAGVTLTFDPEDLRVKQIKNETERFKPLSFAEKDKIFGHFANHNPSYLNFLLFIYYTCIRPAEIMRLQIEYINMEERTIYVPWFNSKNGLSKYVQILDPLYNVLKNMKIDKYKSTDYLFSHRFEPGHIKKTSHNSSENWLEARRSLSMGDLQMYGLKHTFNRDYVENNKNNIDWEWLRRHNRHATIQQTQDYISDLTAYFLDQAQHKIIDYSIKR